MSAVDVLAVDDDTYRILSTGAYREGAVYCHLASTTRFREQRNGRIPVQIAMFIDAEKVEAAMNRPSGFFSWNRALRGAFERGERDAADGKSAAECPYEDHRKPSGRLSWSRSFINAWNDGHRAALARVGGAA